MAIPTNAVPQPDDALIEEVSNDLSQFVSAGEEIRYDDDNDYFNVFNFLVQHLVAQWKYWTRLSIAKNSLRNNYSHQIKMEKHMLMFHEKDSMWK